VRVCALHPLDSCCPGDHKQAVSALQDCCSVAAAVMNSLLGGFLPLVSGCLSDDAASEQTGEDLNLLRLVKHVCCIDLR